MAEVEGSFTSLKLRAIMKFLCLQEKSATVVQTEMSQTDENRVKNLLTTLLKHWTYFDRELGALSRDKVAFHPA